MMESGGTNNMMGVGVGVGVGVGGGGGGGGGGGPFAAVDLRLQQQGYSNLQKQPQQFVPPSQLGLIGGHPQHNRHHHHHHVQDPYSLCEQPSAVAPAVDYSNGGKRDLSKISTTSEDDDNEEGGVEDHSNEGERGVGGGPKKAVSSSSPWHRMKWTDAMVRLLITIVSYIGEDAATDCTAGGRRRRLSLLQKKGKWKLVSKVMAERGYYVSPQQCEDKFNDLNKRYKRLNEILGRGTACDVVENPTLLDVMHHVSDKGKEDVRKILSSKHLFYEEMCSYHNCNRLHLPHDPSLQHLLQQFLHSNDDPDNHRKGAPAAAASSQDHTHEEELGGADTDDNDDEPYDATTPGGGGGGGVGGGGAGCFHNKRMRNGPELEVCGAVNANQYGLQECDKGLQQPQGISVDINQVFSEGPRDLQSQRQLMMTHSLQLEERRLQIQARMLELENHRFKWQRFSKKKDRELEKMRMENERMKLENENLSLQLKQKAFDVGLHQFAT